jgi:hypothetical protein
MLDAANLKALGGPLKRRYPGERRHHPRDAEVLAKLCGILGSSHDREQANAATLATRRLQALGLSWEAFVERAVRPPLAVQPPPPPPLPRASGRCAQAEALLQRGVVLSAWERGFLPSLAVRHRPLTLRQCEKLDEVAERVGARAG